MRLLVSDHGAGSPFPPGPTRHAYLLPWSLRPVGLLACPDQTRLSDPTEATFKIQCWLCFDTGSLCITAQAGLEQLLIALPLLPESRDHRLQPAQPDVEVCF